MPLGRNKCQITFLPGRNAAEPLVSGLLASHCCDLKSWETTAGKQQEKDVSAPKDPSTAGTEPKEGIEILIFSSTAHHNKVGSGESRKLCTSNNTCKY